MALDTYANLQTAISNYLDRSDLTAVIPDFITLCEAAVNRSLRHWRMEKRSTASVSTQYVDLPTDWVETIRYNIQADRKLSLISVADMMNRRDIDDTSGKPVYYAHVGGEIEHYPTPDQAYTTEILYYAKVPALADDNTSNWLLSEAPDVYLYGSLLHSAPYLVEDQRIAVWGALYADALKALQAKSDAARFSGTGLKIK